jgi:predicted nucleic acid-binding protein
VKWFFDTSVLIAAFLEDHENHERSFAVFTAANRSVACCAGHSLAEVYATVTRLPGKYRMSGQQVLFILEEIEERLAIVSLESDEYLAVIRQAAGSGIVGGTVYDALLAGCAMKANAETIYTWDERHFRLFGSEIATRVRKP